MDLLNDHKDYIIVNIANEWQGSWDKGSLWSDTYIEAIKKYGPCEIHRRSFIKNFV